MRVLVQRSNQANVIVDEKVVGKIDSGLVLLVGFTDENGVMNKSILDYGGSVLSISQFTLYADTKKGNRPSYIAALRGEESSKLYDLFNEELRKYVDVQTGIFGADMLVNISNVGPTTILLEK